MHRHRLAFEPFWRFWRFYAHTLQGLNTAVVRPPFWIKLHNTSEACIRGWNLLDPLFEILHVDIGPLKPRLLVQLAGQNSWATVQEKSQRQQKFLFNEFVYCFTPNLFPSLTKSGLRPYGCPPAVCNSEASRNWDPRLDYPASLLEFFSYPINQVLARSHIEGLCFFLPLMAWLNRARKLSRMLTYNKWNLTLRLSVAQLVPCLAMRSPEQCPGTDLGPE